MSSTRRAGMAWATGAAGAAAIVVLLLAWRGGGARLDAAPPVAAEAEVSSTPTWRASPVVPSEGEVVQAQRPSRSLMEDRMVNPIRPPVLAPLSESVQERHQRLAEMMFGPGAADPELVETNDERDPEEEAANWEREEYYDPEWFPVEAAELEAEAAEDEAYGTSPEEN